MGPAADHVVHHMTVIRHLRVALHRGAQRLRLHGGHFRHQKSRRLLHAEKRRHGPILHRLGGRRGVVQILPHFGIAVHLLQYHGQAHIQLQAGLQLAVLLQPAGIARQFRRHGLQRGQILFPRIVAFIDIGQPPAIGLRNLFPLHGLHGMSPFWIDRSLVYHGMSFLSIGNRPPYSPTYCTNSTAFPSGSRKPMARHCHG